jgi:hypothetical protein
VANLPALFELARRLLDFPVDHVVIRITFVLFYHPVVDITMACPVSCKKLGKT